MSEYTRQLDMLEAAKCRKCYGLGEIDDAEPGDISFNHMVCPYCGGTGLTKGVPRWGSTSSSETSTASRR